MTEAHLSAAYDPSRIEQEWFARWEEALLFRADPGSPKPKYSIALPPPNVTGELHMGHALNASVQDAWARYRRMTGYEVLYLPGTDHAAIATQNVIERQLAAEGLAKEDLGRAAFAERVDRWYAQIGSTIVSQFRLLGASMDLSRLRFTMDAAYVRAVRTAFVRFYEKGWIYRAPRIVNWCPRCLSAISDLEVDWREHEDVLYRIRYDLEGGGSLTIATVRPETLLADTGVAVHPEDPRYRGMVGGHAILPLVGRRLPVVADAHVDREFGTGALKVTPGHDPMDYEIGQRHGLELISGMHPDGRLNVPFAPRYDGLEALEARRLVVADLEAAGRLVSTEPYRHDVGHCDRSGDVIEPLISEQWWLRMGDMAAAALASSRAGQLRWHPERYERTYLEWLENLRDWCISRQLWLGHQIPLTHCDRGHTFASVDEPAACPDCGSVELRPETDVLDTWFSSALWPFATLGWPERTPELEAFYPTDMNCTAREIIRLWVSRMVMTGLEFMGAVPFADVAITCVVQTPDGHRMSKSKGNVVDPRALIERYGADSLRAWASSVAMSSQDVRFDESRIEGYRRFSNKLWNASRLVLGSLGADRPAAPVPGSDLALEDRWILSRLDRTRATVTDAIEQFWFQAGIDAIYDFAWGDFCDWYLEAVKPRLRDRDPMARAVALHVLDVLLRLLHPFMPFVTEELWHRLPGRRHFLVRETWPAPMEFEDAAAEEAFQTVRSEVAAIRATRQAAGAPPAGGLLQPGEMPAELLALVAVLARVEVVATTTPASRHPLASGAFVEFPQATAAVAARNRADLARLGAELARGEAKLANPSFRERAPAEIVTREEHKVEELRAAMARLAGSNPDPS